MGGNRQAGIMRVRAALERNLNTAMDGYKK